MKGWHEVPDDARAFAKDLADGEPRLQGRMWTTKDGRVLHVSQMTPEHAGNTFRFLQRQVEYAIIREGLLVSMYADDAGDMASLALEREAERIAGLDAGDVLSGTRLGRALRQRAGL